MSLITVPLFSFSGRRLINHMPIDLIEKNEHHFRIVRNRRGHIKRAYVKKLQSFDSRPNSLIGVAFEQKIESGEVWALRGVQGS